MNSFSHIKIPFKYFATIISALILFSFTEKNSAPPSKTILLIPYQRTMHLSDADDEIADASKISVKQVRVQMRNSLMEKISLALWENYDVRMLMEFGTAQEKNDLGDFYDQENLFLSKTNFTSGSASADTSGKSNPYFSVFNKSNSTDYNASFMNVALSKPVYFQKLANDYDADCFLILTQLEIKTHYNECIDIASRIFRREFRLHYATFDAGGNQTGGGYVSADVGSGVKNINQVSESVLADVVRKVKTALK